MARAWVALAVLLAPALPAGAQQLPLRVPPHIQERRLEHRVPPEYPEAARRARIEGAVRLAVSSARTARCGKCAGSPAIRYWPWRPWTR
jgi:hypothetical protein